MDRRKFLKLSSLTANSMSSIVKIGSNLALSSHFVMASETFTDYKALVVIFLDGGNDSMNMFVPTGTTQYDTYKTIREEYAINANGYATNRGLGIAKTNLYSKIKMDTKGHFLWHTTDGQPYKDVTLSNDGLSDEAIRSYRKRSL